MLPKKIGGYGEFLARSYLTKRCYTIIGQNVYVQYGEIDLIASKGKCVLFFEVKYSRSKVPPEEMYTASKRHKFLRAVGIWLNSNTSGSFDHARMGLIAIHQTFLKTTFKIYLDSMY